MMHVRPRTRQATEEPDSELAIAPRLVAGTRASVLILCAMVFALGSAANNSTVEAVQVAEAKLGHVWNTAEYGLPFANRPTGRGSAVAQSQDIETPFLPELYDLEDVADLRARFMADDGLPRLLLVMSPT